MQWKWSFKGVKSRLTGMDRIAYKEIMGRMGVDKENIYRKGGT